MMSNEQWTLILSVCIFFLVLGVLAAFLWYRRYLSRIADEIAQHRAQTSSEHGNIATAVSDGASANSKELKKANGRLQWLIANKLAAELGKLKGKDGKPPLDPQPPPTDDTN